MCDEAVEAFIRSGHVRSAVDACVYLNHWDLAIQLAKRFQLKEISHLLSQYAAHLLEKQKMVSLIELYRTVNHHHRSSHYLFTAAEELAGISDQTANEARKGNEMEFAGPMLLKKIYVLAAMEAEAHLAAKKKSVSEVKQVYLHEKISN
jgi:WD repeat-containing protein 35